MLPASRRKEPPLGRRRSDGHIDRLTKESCQARMGHRKQRTVALGFLLAALLPSLLPPACGIPLVCSFVRPDRRIHVFRDLIVTSDRDSGHRVALRVAPYEIKDCAADPRGAYVFAILGRRGGFRGQRLAVYSVGARVRLAWLDRDRGHQPWKIATGDVDGDGALDVCVTVWKKTRFHPVLDNRPFLYSWDGNQLFPKWLGSRLSSPFIDLALRDLDGDGRDELVALEEQRDGLKRVMSYKWYGFGFTGFRILRRNLRARSLSQVKGVGP